MSRPFATAATMWRSTRPGGRVPRALGRIRLRTRSRRALTIAFSLALASPLVFSTSALAKFITPESGGSPNANDIASLYRITLYIAAVVFVAVEGTLLYSVIKFRARRRRRAPAALQTHGNTRLEITWTVGAAVILVALAILTFAKLSSIQNPPNSGPGGLFANAAADASGPGGQLYASTTRPEPPNGRKLTIKVSGQQYIWRFDYPNGVFSYEQMVVPVHTTVVLPIISQDVVHSWWIPTLGGKFDAVPGLTNYTWFKISKPGVYTGQCAELCGRNHADMRASVRAVSVPEYKAWLSRQKAGIQRAQKLDQKGPPAGSQ